MLLQYLLIQKNWLTNRINFPGYSPDGYDSQNHTYGIVGTYTVTVEAKSLLQTKSATYTIVCEEKVTENFDLTSTFPQDFDIC